MMYEIDYSKFQSNSAPSKLSGEESREGKILERALKATKSRINDQQDQFRSVSAFGKDQNHCLCKVFGPVILLWKFFGVLPVSHDRGNCRMKHKWISFSTLLNISWIITIVVGFIIGTPSLKRMFDTEFRGIDVYTFSIVLVVEFSSTIIIFLAGNFSAPKFLKAWDELHAAVAEVAMPNFQKVKLLIYLLPLFLTQEVFVNACIMTWVIFHGGLSLHEVPLTATTGTMVANFIPNLVTGIYSVFLSIVSHNFKSINNNLQMTLKQASTDLDGQKHWSPLLATKIKRARILHEKLCQANRSVEKSFGIQIMAIFISTGVTYVTGIYGLIIGTQGLAPARVDSLVIGFSLTSILGAVRVVMLIWFCQSAIDEANGAANILNSFDSDNYSEEVSVQVDKFLHKLGNFPLQTRCCNVFQLGNGFYSSAASAIVTYVLILIQFRLDD